LIHFFSGGGGGGGGLSGGVAAERNYTEFQCSVGSDRNRTMFLTTLVSV
jgi:hypothetical protein